MNRAATPGRDRHRSEARRDPASLSSTCQIRCYNGGNTEQKRPSGRPERSARSTRQNDPSSTVLSSRQSPLRSKGWRSAQSARMLALRRRNSAASRARGSPRCIPGILSRSPAERARHAHTSFGLCRIVAVGARRSNRDIHTLGGTITFHRRVGLTDPAAKSSPTSCAVISAKAVERNHGHGSNPGCAVSPRFHVPVRDR